MMKKTFAPVLAFALVLALVGLALACAQAPEAPEATNTLPRPENPALGVAIGAVPPEFEVAVNEGDQLRLRRQEIGGELYLEVESPEAGGVNLVELVRRWEETYNERPQGKFHGQIELGTQFGSAYTVRGTYETEGGELVEERRIFAVHPTGDKALIMVYTYPSPANSRERTDEMLDLFSEVESLDFQIDEGVPEG